jgi:hypothetical protein
LISNKSLAVIAGVAGTLAAANAQLAPGAMSDSANQGPKESVPILTAPRPVFEFEMATPPRRIVDAAAFHLALW